MGNRVIWLDNVKVAAMFLVLMGHLGLENPFISDWIPSFHLAVFFFVSGIFASARNGFREFVKNNLLRLIVPVILWQIIGSICWCPIMIYYQHPDDFLSAFISTEYDFLIGRECGFGWFMFCLFGMRVEFYVLSRLSKWILYVVGLFVFPIIAFYIGNVVKLPFYFTNSLMAFPFYLLGYLFRNRLINLNISYTKSGVACIVTFVLTLILCYFWGTNSLHAVEFGKYPPLLYIQGGVGCLFVTMLCYSIPVTNRIVRILGGGTIVLLLLQPPFLLLSRIIYRLIARPQHPAPYFDLCSGILFSLLIMWAMVPVIIIIEKYAPILNGSKKKDVLF